MKRVSGEGLAKLAIPVPPLDEQERIVAILDKFDALVNDLSIGLPAELNARRQAVRVLPRPAADLRGSAA